ncbi:MAG: hypothetical protein IPL39_01065 [Opitutaceae bacterium]|nr:hypothetical protein [Opitutaceae bacterium]
MKHTICTALLFGIFVCTALAGGEPVKDAPSVLRLASGKEIKVLSITRTTLHGSDEPAVSLQYETTISFQDMAKLWSEVEQVWAALRPIAEQQKVHAAVVTANQPASSFLPLSKGAGWAWKQRADGSWGAPPESDHARVPK